MLTVKACSLYLVFCDFQLSVVDTQSVMPSSEGSPFVLAQNMDFGMSSSDLERKSLIHLIDIVDSACCSV